MKKNNWKHNPVLGLAVLFLAASAVGATPAAPSDDADHEALRNLKTVYEQAVNNNQMDMLKPLFAEGFTAVMVTGEPVAGFEEMMAYWSKIRGMMGTGGRYQVTVHPERSLLFGSWALARGTMDNVVTNENNKVYEFQSHWTALCRKEAGAWKILRGHGSMDPIGNPFVVYQSRQIAKIAGGLSGFGGLLLGGVGGFLVGRRRGSVTRA